jgi:hypothetical protein
VPELKFRPTYGRSGLRAVGACAQDRPLVRSPELGTQARTWYVGPNFSSGTLVDVAAAAAEESRDLAGVEALTHQPSVKTSEGLAIGGQRLTAKAPGERVGEEAVLIYLGEDCGDRGMCGVAVHTERLHLSEHPTSSLPLDGDVMTRPRPRRPAVVEQSGSDQRGKCSRDDLVGVVAAPEAKPGL